MNIRILKITLLLPLLLSLTSVVQGEALLRLQGSIWEMEPSGTASFGVPGVVHGTRFDIANDLGYGADSEAIPSGTIVLGGVTQLGISWFSMDLQAAETIERSIQFKDLEFTARSRVESSLEALLVRGFLRLGVPAGPVSGGAEAGIAYADVSTKATAVGIGSTGADANGIVPYAGLYFQATPFELLTLEALLRYGKWSITDYEVAYLEYEVGARLNIGPAFFGTGYRQIQLEGKDKDERIDIDLEFSGPLLYGGFAF